MKKCERKVMEWKNETFHFRLLEVCRKSDQNYVSCPNNFPLVWLWSKVEDTNKQSWTKWKLQSVWHKIRPIHSLSDWDYIVYNINSFESF